MGVMKIKKKRKPIRILIVDEQTLFRSGLKMLLEKEEDIVVAGDVSSAEEALDYLKSSKCDLVLMDTGLPGMNGLEATRKIKEREPEKKVLILTMFDHEPYLLKALEAGVSAYLLKDIAVDELVSAIRRAMDDEVIVHPSLVKVLVKEVLGEKKEVSGESSGSNVLTKREKEILKYISLGYTNQELAELLMVSVKTIEKHKANIMEKLNLARRYQLVNYAIKHGLVSLNEITE